MLFTFSAVLGRLLMLTTLVFLPAEWTWCLLHSAITKTDFYEGLHFKKSFIRHFEVGKCFISALMFFSLKNYTNKNITQNVRVVIFPFPLCLKAKLPSSSGSAWGCSLSDSVFAVKRFFSAWNCLCLVEMQNLISYHLWFSIYDFPFQSPISMGAMWLSHMFRNDSGVYVGAETRWHKYYTLDIYCIISCSRNQTRNHQEMSSTLQSCRSVDCD